MTSENKNISFEAKARYRQKLGKTVIEVWNGEKWIYVRTLKNPLIEFRQECLKKCLFSPSLNNKKEVQKGV